MKINQIIKIAHKVRKVHQTYKIYQIYQQPRSVIVGVLNISKQIRV